MTHVTSVVRRLLRLLALSFVVTHYPAIAATFTVNSTVDALDSRRGDGVCETAAGNGVCTLRAAIQESNGIVGPDTIVLPAGTYTIGIRPTIAGGDINGSFDIRDHLTIVGAGVDATIIDGGALDSIFVSAAASKTIHISSLTIQNGSVAATRVGGGGIYAPGASDITLADVVVQGNHARQGGGIYNLGKLTLIRSIVRGNTALRLGLDGVDDRRGGGIHHAQGTLTVRDSVIVDNTAGAAGGLFNMGTAVIEASTVSGNLATNFQSDNGNGGGGIVNGGGSAGGTLTVTNSTVSGNRADGHHGGIYNHSGGIALNNVTLANNVADADGDGFGNSGGIGLGNAATAMLRNSIVAGNRAAGPAQDCFSLNGGALSSGGYNLIGHRGAETDCAFTPATGDLVGVAAAPIDPGLHPLADYGGPTFTHALTESSLARDAGDPAGCSDGTVGLTTDQRGAPRVGGEPCDIGAYELNRPVANAGIDQRVNADTAVTLDGSGSAAWGGIGSYAWTQIAGVPVALAQPDSAMPAFTAPAVAGALTFQLTIADRYGMSASDSVTVVVNGAPVADAGTDQTANAGAAVSLNGTASRDADGSIVGYAWTQTGGTAVTLTGADSAMPSFTAPATAQTMTFQLMVTDNDGASSVDSVAVAVTVPAPTSANKPPIAKAGRDETVHPRSVAILSGRKSYDPDGRIVRYRWVQIGGAPVTLYGASWSTAVFFAPKTEGALTFQLTVTDNKGATGTDTITITVDRCVRRWYERFFGDRDRDHRHGHRRDCR